MRRAIRRSTVDRLYLEKSWPVRTRKMAKNAAQQVLVDIADFGDRSLDLPSMRSNSCFARSRTGMTKSATPVAMALRGIEAYSASVGVLHQDDAARFLHRARAERAVRSGAAKNDGKAVAELIGQRAKEQIDRRPLAARLVEGKGRNLVVDHLQAAIRRNDVNVVGLQTLAAR